MNALPHLLIEPGDSAVRIGDDALPIRGRAYALLLALARNAGEIVSVRDLMDRVWPDRRVDEANLRNKINMLRRALGDVILNVPGRGYVLVAPVAIAGRAPMIAPPLVPMLGRTGDAARLDAALGRDRFVTITGPGGVGKSMLARACLGAVQAPLIVDLAEVGKPDELLPTLAAALDLPHSAGHAHVSAALNHAANLIVFDNCERLAGTVAALAGALFVELPTLGILATSRQPLRAHGETCLALAPFPVPETDAVPDLDRWENSAAVRLFRDRFAACGGHGEITRDALRMVLNTCRALDGLPLAIELAAMLAATHGLAVMPVLRADSLGVLTGGQRSAPARHRSLRATVEHSHDLLSPHERIVFRRLAALPPIFAMADAEMAMGPSHVAQDIAQALVGLAAKSCLIADGDAGRPVYRLPETMRSLAALKLREAGEWSLLEAGMRR